MRASLWSTAFLVSAVAFGESGERRLATVDYSPDRIYTVVGVPGYAIDVQFGEDEHFEGVGGGDLEAVSVEAHGAHVFLKPKARHVTTNLTVLTNRHVYQFGYRVETVPGLEPVLYALRFRYPEEAARHEAAEEAQKRVQRSLATARPALNRAYGFCGARSLKPSAASDDGVETRLAFPGRVELPVVYVRNDDGTESLVNITVDSEGLLIHRVARTWVLRRGLLVACIQNLGYIGGADSLPNGTVSPQVKREPVEIAP